MKNTFLLSTLLITTLSIVGCQHYAKSTQTDAVSSTCHFNDVNFDTQFPAARLDKCEQTGKNRYKLTLQPENMPINDSPWYAFSVSGKFSHTIHIDMHVEGGSNRYHPKIRVDQESKQSNWQKIPFKRHGEVMTFDLDINQQPTLIAGQEIITNDDYDNWYTALKNNGQLDIITLGQSVNKRPIKAIIQRHNAKQWLVVLGRQHPPEITGALALFPFTETLLADTPQARHFRTQYNVLVIPNLNPDGVQLGNWRHNANGVDLNRDWKAFKQPETQAVHQYLTQLVKEGHSIAYAVDFHSTRKDIFYTMPHTYPIKNPMLTTQWLEQLDQQMPSFQVIQKPGNNPNKGVFKQYISDTYRVHAVTYEMGDNTNREKIKTIAHTAANTLMNTLLQTTEAP